MILFIAGRYNRYCHEALVTSSLLYTPNVPPTEQGSVKNKKVKASHTRYRALGPELIPVYRQSARR